MEIMKSLLLLAAGSFLLCACNDKMPPEESRAQQPPKNAAQTKTTTIPDQPVKGIILGHEFQVEQAKLENGILTLRQGKDFFADRSIDIFTFEDGSLDNKSIIVSSNTGFGSPHLHLGVRKVNKNVPDKTVVMDGYEMELSFGQAEKLGIPFSIKLTVDKDPRTEVAGKYLATFGDIQPKGGEIDLTHDSFDTLGHVARKYLEPKYPNVQFEKSFGASYTSHGEADFPKVGFIGYEVNGNGVSPSVIKVQLYKDENGWRVANELSESQIHQAHPVGKYPTEHERSVQGHLATVATALKLESDLNDQNMMPNVRATSVNCYVTKNLDKASCRTMYAVRKKDDIDCTNKSYLVTRTAEKWNVEKEISDTEKVDYSSGELVPYKPFGLPCT